MLEDHELSFGKSQKKSNKDHEARDMNEHIVAKVFLVL